MCRLMFYIKSGDFSATISSKILSVSFFIFTFWDFYYVYGGTLDGVPQVFEALFIFTLF